MPSDDADTERTGRLIERLLVDPAFRVQFRRDPGGACLAAGLPELAAELAGAGGSAMETLELRESRSSLAGVVMAVALEGVAFEQLARAAEHGLPGGLGKLLDGAKLPRGAAGLKRAATPAGLEHAVERKAGVSGSELRSGEAVERAAARSDSGAAAANHPAQPAPSAPSQQPAPSGQAQQPAPSAPSQQSAVSGQAQQPAVSGQAQQPAVSGQAQQPAPVAPSQQPSVAAVQQPSAASPQQAPVVQEPPAGSSSTVAPASVSAPVSTPAPEPAALPVAAASEQAGAPATTPVGAGGAAQVVSGAGGASGGVAAVLGSSGLSAPVGVREWLGSGGVDPRVVSVLGGLLSRFSVGVGSVEVLSSPVHVQVLEIVSVDGEPVGPQNFAARELVGELAGLGVGVRPDEVGSPWAIQSPGFYSDGGSGGSLRLAFESPGANSQGAAPPAGVAVSAPAAASSEAVAAPQAAVVGTGAPVAAGAPTAAAGQAPVGYPAGTYPAASPPGAAAGVDQLAGAGGSLGAALDPASTGKLDAMVHQADALVGLPYVWGGGHEGWGPQAGYDCSGFVSKVLHAAGFLSQPVTTDNLVGQPGIASGPGSHVTIYDRAHPVTGESEGHVIMCINGQFYESGGQHGAWGGGGGVEKIGRPSAAYLATFTNVLHPEGL